MPVTAKVGGPGLDQTAVSVTETEGGPAELERTSSQRGCENYFLATVRGKVFFFLFLLKEQFVLSQSISKPLTQKSYLSVL